MKQVARQLRALIGLGLILTVPAPAGRASEPTSSEVPGTDQPQEALLGGATTVFDTTRNAFSLPLPNMRDEHRSSFFVGNSFFNQNWVVAPASAEARDGLGPLFNARSCSACHFKDGRGRPPEPGEAMTAMLLRVSVPGTNVHGGPKPEPAYGDQIQGAAIPGVPPEGDVLVSYKVIDGEFGDGEAYTLRQPVVRISNPGYGPLSAALLMSARVGPAMIGLGLLEAVPEDTLRQLADPDDRDGDGISGRLNTVWDVASRRPRLGRFGWKAEQPTILQHTAAAFQGDIGITSSLMPQENHTDAEGVCRSKPSGGTPELSDQILRDVALYVRTLAVPAQRNPGRPTVQRGRILFRELGCASCHVSQLETGPWPDLPELAHQIIRPYTDLLLHDMGEGLADHRPVFEASGREWRTPPLWGLGLLQKVNGHTFLLHDGRARTLAEAILWHDGEARTAREKFRQVPANDRNALLAFLESL